MGGLLSRMAPMELRREEGPRAEPYNMLLESEATLRSQRALKRELCFTRAAVIVLVLALFLCLCLMFFVQPLVCKDTGHGGKANGDQNQSAQEQIAARDSNLKQPRLAFMTGNQDVQQDNGYKQSLSTTLRVNCSAVSTPGSKNISWMMENQDVAGFTLNDSKSLVVPTFGMYRISLQVTYRNPDSKKNEEEKIVLSHRVVAYDEGYPKPRTVMEVFESAYWKNFMWIKTKYSEDVVRLNEGNIIRVESSNLSFIHCGASFLTIRYDPTG